ncbi:MAG: acyltransferase [Bacteroidetes bacterium]|nr:MAG: acyltransferase [Bacteroidota bacterium]
MKKALCHFILRLWGWQINPNSSPELYGKCVVIAAPHTSNWDYPLALLSMGGLGVKLRYTIKKQWLRPPFGWFIRLLGGIGVERTPQEKGANATSLVDAIAGLFDEHEQLCVIVQAEGTRALRTQWKTGFYYIALKANVPIALGYLDYQAKVSGIGKIIHPTGDLAKDMREIMAFYEHIPAKFPAKFALDERFVLTNTK